MINQDKAMNAILGHLELLQELAIAAGDADLAQDLSVAFAKSLERYCQSKANALSTQLEEKRVSAA